MKNSNEISLNYTPKRRFSPVKLKPDFLDVCYEVKSIYAAIGDYHLFYKTLPLTRDEARHARAMIHAASSVAKKLPPIIKHKPKPTKHKKYIYLPATAIPQRKPEWSDGIYLSLSQKGIMNALLLIRTEFYKAVMKKLQSLGRQDTEMPSSLVIHSKIEEVRELSIVFLDKVNSQPHHQYLDINDVAEALVHQQLDSLWIVYCTAKKDNITSFFDEPADDVMLAILDGIGAKIEQYDVSTVKIEDYKVFINRILGIERLQQLFGLRLDLYLPPR